MPTLGLTKLNAVNRMLYAVNERPVPSLTPGGSTIEADAERFLDDYNDVVQTYGWPENTRFFEDITSDGTGIITVPSDTLKIWPSGRNEYRTIVLQSDQLVDQNNNTTNFGANVMIQFDRVRRMGFENTSPSLKELILTTAMCYFQQRIRGSMTMDAMIQQERALAEMMADRNQSRLARRPINLQPIIATMRGVQSERQ